tara:strand:+ start:2815 stop:3795 length:981 start_codon:yes stop_codon:yes gene_type:complete
MKIICEVTRGEYVESRHEVYVVAIDEAEKIIFRSGDPKHITCIRSALKPFQASASIKVGAVAEAKFTDEEVALMCSSHNGENIHINTAHNMLKKLGFHISDYECGIHYPHNKEVREQMWKHNNKATPLHNNCSGKHAGMLSLAKYLQVSSKGYIQWDHPVQKKIFEQISRLTGYKTFSYGIDGCSAPTPFLSLLDIAKLYLKLGSDKYSELSIAYNAMSEHPYFVGGKNRFDTDFNAVMRGRGVCKAGGEAVRGLVIKTEKYGLMGLAIKIIDGNQRAIEVGTMAALNTLDILHNKEKDKLSTYENKPLTNCNKFKTGKIISRIIK